jgi:hypothetical protein
MITSSSKQVPGYEYFQRIRFFYRKKEKIQGRREHGVLVYIEISTIILRVLRGERQLCGLILLSQSLPTIPLPGSVYFLFSTIKFYFKFIKPSRDIPNDDI